MILKKVFLCIVLILCGLGLRAQAVDLKKWSSGRLLEFKSLSKPFDFYGYLALFDMGVTNVGKKRFQYVLFDKNLNIFANNEFEEASFILGYNAALNDNNEVVLTPFWDEFHTDRDINNFTYIRPKIINTKTNQIRDYFPLSYRNEQIVVDSKPLTMSELKSKEAQELEAAGFIGKSTVDVLPMGEYFILDKRFFKKGGGLYSKGNTLVVLDNTKKELWKIAYNSVGTDVFTEFYNLIDSDSNYIYLLKGLKQGDIIKSSSLEIRGLKDGELKKAYNMNAYSHKTILDFINLPAQQKKRQFDDKFIYILHNYDDKENPTGLIRFVIDKKTLDLQAKDLSLTSTYEQCMTVPENGRIERDVRLKLCSRFIMKDGRIATIYEKVKKNNAKKKSGIVLITTNADFSLDKVKFVEPPMKSTNFLHGQYLNDNDFVFFYEIIEYWEDNVNSEAELSINTMVNNVLKEKKMDCRSTYKRFYRHAYPAKKGYVLFFDYRDWSTQIRIEKINY